MAKKNYEISITAFTTVIVIGAESKKEAQEWACDMVDMGDLDLDSGETKRIIPDDDLENSKRHYKVFEIED